MALGVQIFDASSVLEYDTTTALGGAVVGDFRYYTAGASGETISYTQWTGLSAILLTDGGLGEHASLDMSSGYPVVTITTPTQDGSFALAVY